MSAQQNRLADTAGNFLAKHIKVVLSCLAAFFLLIYFYSWYSERQATADEKKVAQILAAQAKVNREKYQEQVKMAAAALEQKCSVDFQALATKASALIEAGDANAGFALVKECNSYTQSSVQVKEFLKQASIAAATQSAAAMKREEVTRLAAAKKADAADKTERRKQGVLIGMTREEVQLSNWGKPRKINRTTGATFEHEQWVYDGSYLYFRQGILTTIQN